MLFRSSELAQLAVTEERLRIARDLHDLLGHTLSLIALKSELARRLARGAPERAEAEIADVERAARAALQEVREAVAGYRQPTLASELRAARELLAAAGIAFTYEETDAANGAVGAVGLPVALEATLAWAMREGVTNVIRHSRARACAIHLDHQPAALTITIADDGHSAPDAGNAVGNGLRGLAERVAALGGTCESGACESGMAGAGGFRLAVTLPLQTTGNATNTALTLACAGPSSAGI